MTIISDYKYIHNIPTNGTYYETKIEEDSTETRSKGRKMRYMSKYITTEVRCKDCVRPPVLF